MSKKAQVAVGGGDMANKITLCILYILILSSCTLPSSAPSSTGPGQSFVLVTPNPSALPTPTPFQPAGAILAPPDSPTLASTFTSLPPTDTPLPTLEFTATTLPLLTSPAPSTRTHYTLFAILDYVNNQIGRAHV